MKEIAFSVLGLFGMAAYGIVMFIYVIVKTIADVFTKIFTFGKRAKQ